MGQEDLLRAATEAAKAAGGSSEELAKALEIITAELASEQADDRDGD